MYSVDGQHVSVELLSEDEASELLRTLQGRVKTDLSDAEARTLTQQIAAVDDWLCQLAGEAADARTADAAAEHAADLLADHLAGVLR